MSNYAFILDPSLSKEEFDKIWDHLVQIRDRWPKEYNEDLALDLTLWPHSVHTSLNFSVHAYGVKGEGMRVICLTSESSTLDEWGITVIKTDHLEQIDALDGVLPEPLL